MGIRFLLLTLGLVISPLLGATELYQAKPVKVSQLDYKLSWQGRELTIKLVNQGTKELPPILPLAPQFLNSQYQVLKDSCSHFSLKPNSSCEVIVEGKDQPFVLLVRPYDEPQSIVTIAYKMATPLSKPISGERLPVIKEDKIGVGSFFEKTIEIPGKETIKEAVSLSNTLVVKLVSQKVAGDKVAVTFGIVPLVEDFLEEEIALIGEERTYIQPFSLVGYFRFPKEISILNPPTVVGVGAQVPLQVKVVYGVGLPMEEIVPVYEVDWLTPGVNQQGNFIPQLAGSVKVAFKSRGKDLTEREIKVVAPWPQGSLPSKTVKKLETLDCEQVQAFQSLTIEKSGVLEVLSESGYCILGVQKQIRVDGRLKFVTNNDLPEVQFNSPDFQGALVGDLISHKYPESFGGWGQGWKNFSGGQPQAGNGGGGAGSFSDGEIALNSRGGYGGIDVQRKRVGGTGGTRGLRGGILYLQAEDLLGSGVIDVRGEAGQAGSLGLTKGGSGAGGHGGVIVTKVKHFKFQGKLLITGGKSPEVKGCPKCQGTAGAGGRIEQLKFVPLVEYSESIKENADCDTPEFTWRGFLSNSFSAASKTSLDQVMRYFLVGLFFTLFIRLFMKRKKIQTANPSKKDYQREIKYSLISALLINGLTVGFILNPLTSGHKAQVYYVIGDYPLWYYFLSFILIIILHDIYFYFSHRLLHTKWWYQKVHYIHHQSKNPSVWATFSFHPMEALIHFLFVPIVTWIIPFHSDVLLFFLWWMILLNAHGHCGHEFFPRWFIKLSKGWFNNSEHHNMHHEYNHGNYSIYFNLLDRWFKTNHPKYPERMKKYDE